MLDPSDNHALWEQVVAHLQERATNSVDILRDNDSERKIMIVGSNNEMTVTFVPERNAVRWETRTEYGFERLQEPLSALTVRLMQWFSRD